MSKQINRRKNLYFRYFTPCRLGILRKSGVCLISVGRNCSRVAKGLKVNHPILSLVWRHRNMQPSHIFLVDNLLGVIRVKTN